MEQQPLTEPAGSGMGLPPALQHHESMSDDTLLADNEHSPAPAKEEIEHSPDSSYSDKMDFQKIMVIIALGLTYTGSSIPGYFIGPSLNYVAADLHLGTQRSWVPSAHSLASAVTVPCAGYLQDMIGRRGTLAFGYVCMIVGTIVYGLAENFTNLVVGSTLLGVAAAIEELTAYAAIAELVPARLRGVYFAFMVMLSIVFTPSLIYAGELSTNATWRWLMWINLIYNGIAIVLAGVFYFTMKLKRANSNVGWETLKQLDYVGIVLLVVGVTEFLVAMESGGITYGWTSAYVLVQLLVGLGLIAIFVFWESRGYGKPLVPKRLFQGQRVVAVTFVICFLSTPVYNVALNLGPTFLSSVYQKSALETGLIAFGPSISLAIGAILSNVLLSVLRGYAREQIFAFMCLMAAFTAASTVIDPTNYVLYAILGSFASLGTGGALVPLPTVASLACPQDLIGTAVALTILLRTLGGVVGYAIFYNIFVSRLGQYAGLDIGKAVVEAGLPRKDAAKFIPAFVKDFTEGLPMSNLKVPPKILKAAAGGFAQAAASAASEVYLITLAFSGAALLATLCLPNIKQYLTKRVVARTTTMKRMPTMRGTSRRTMTS